MSGSKTSCPKRKGAKRSGPKRLRLKSPGAKTLPEPSLHDCETSSMIVTLSDAFFRIVRFFYYYHLNLIYDSLIGLT